MKLKTNHRRTLLMTVLSISEKEFDRSHGDQIDLRDLTVQQQRLLLLDYKGSKKKSSENVEVKKWMKCRTGKERSGEEERDC